jgi:hypothetical protein
MNGEAMLLIVFGIAVILLLSLIVFFLVINPKRNARMFTQAMLEKLSPASLVDGESLTDYANKSLDKAINSAHSLGGNAAKLAIQKGVVEGVNLANAQLLNTEPEVENRSEENPEGTPVVDPKPAEKEEVDEQKTE